MKTVILGLIIGTFAWANQVDINKSKVTWKGAKVIGSSHDGEVKIKSAKLKYKDGEPQSGLVVIDMTSLTNNDLKDAQWNAKLVGHLKSDDFFSVEKYKTAELKVNKVLKASDKFYQIHGDLKIKGKSQPIKLKGEVTTDTKSHQIVKVDFTFDRTQFDVKYGSGAFFSNLGDKMIADEVEMSVELYIQKTGALASN